MNSPDGSIWRKWDLHVHTPESVLNNQFGSDWDNYVKKLFRSAIEKDIHAIGITDYFTIEGYKKLKRDYLERNKKLKELFEPSEIEKIKNILVFPNIEFRITNIVDKNKVNFHVLFSDEVPIKDIETHFLHNLKFVYNGDPQNGDYKERLKKETLTEFGRRLKDEHEQFKKNSDLYVGMLCASVSDSDISEELDNKKFKEKFLIGVPPDEDLSKVSWDSQGHQFRKVLIQKSDFLFTTNHSTINWALGKKEGLPKQEKEFKSLKPCFGGSDAHSFERLFEQDKSDHTWIKADLTFEGLRQTIYEPEERVFIGTVPPLIDKVSTNKTKYIRSLQIKKIKNSKLNEDWFDGLNINFNQELVAIIGNKGKGKSAITDVLGMLGDSQNHKHFSFLNDKKFKDKKDKKSEHFEAKIVWEDDEEKKESLNYIPEETAIERVKYIPQSFLEVLCNEDESALDREIKKVIFSHVPEEDASNKENLDELIKFKSSSIYDAIIKLVSDVKNINKEIIDLEEKNRKNSLDQLKSKLAIKQKELENHIESKPKEISKPEGSKDVTKKLNELNLTKTSLSNEQTKIKKEKKKEKDFLTKLINTKTQIETFKMGYDTLSKRNAKILKDIGISVKEVIELKIDFTKINSFISDKKSEIMELEKKLEKDGNLSIPSHIQKIDSDIKKISRNLDKEDKAFQEYTQKHKEWEEKLHRIKGEKAYEDNKDSIKHIQNLISYIEEQLSGDLTEKYDERVGLVKQIFIQKKKLIQIYKELSVPIEKFVLENQLGESEYRVQFSASLQAHNFLGRFIEYINQRKKGTFSGQSEGDKKLLEIFENTDFNEEKQIISFLNRIMESLKFDIRETKKEKRDIHDQIKKEKIEEFYEFLFSIEYLKPKYDLKLGNTSLSKLSPGEKGALLLIFYLLIDKEEIPLILDQPEDNLDNQTVFEIVVKFIKKAKKRRQIIIVTHNPNLAVVCDAEQIIHAGINKKKKYKATYETGSIENPDINKKIIKILEGTLPAFTKRNMKYSITKRLKLQTR